MSSLFGDLPPPASKGSEDAAGDSNNILKASENDEGRPAAVKMIQKKEKASAVTGGVANLPSFSDSAIMPKSIRRRQLPPGSSSGAGQAPIIAAKHHARAPTLIKKSPAITKMRDGVSPVHSTIDIDKNISSIHDEIQELSSWRQREDAYDPEYPNDYGDYAYLMQERHRKEAIANSESGSKSSKSTETENEGSERGNIITLRPVESIHGREGDVLESIVEFCAYRLAPESFKVEMRSIPSEKHMDFRVRCHSDHESIKSLMSEMDKHKFNGVRMKIAFRV